MTVLLISGFGCGKKGPAVDPVPENSAATNPKELIGFLDAKDDRVRVMAIGNLKRLGPAAVDAVPKLEKLAKDKNPKIQQAAQEALKAIKGG